MKYVLKNMSLCTKNGLIFHKIYAFLKIMILILNKFKKVIAIFIYWFIIVDFIIIKKKFKWNVEKK